MSGLWLRARGKLTQGDSQRAAPSGKHICVLAWLAMRRQTAMRVRMLATHAYQPLPS